MKTIIVILIGVLFAEQGFAQKELLSLDEHHQYIYYQVIDIPGIVADTLHNRGLFFLKTAYPKLKIKQTSGVLACEGKFLTYSGVSIVKHENGEINYLLNIECKDGRYRYWLTGFTFTPYQRDRYGNFVAEQGIVIPLETALTKLNKKELDNYLEQTGTFCKQLGDRLRQFMIKPAITPKKEETAKKVVTDKW